jgi:hypothetical protein
MAMKSLIGLVLILIIGRLCYLTFAKIKTHRVSDHLLCGISVAHDKTRTILPWELNMAALYHPSFPRNGHLGLIASRISGKQTQMVGFLHISAK